MGSPLDHESGLLLQFCDTSQPALCGAPGAAGDAGKPPPAARRPLQSTAIAQHTHRGRLSARRADSRPPHAHWDSPEHARSACVCAVDPKGHDLQAAAYPGRLELSSGLGTEHGQHCLHPTRPVCPSFPRIATDVTIASHACRQPRVRRRDPGRRRPVPLRHARCAAGAAILGLRRAWGALGGRSGVASPGRLSAPGRWQPAHAGGHACAAGLRRWRRAACMRLLEGVGEGVPVRGGRVGGRS